MTSKCDGCGDDLIGMYELIDAVEAVIKSSDLAKREALAATIDGYSFPGELEWAGGPQSPALLHHLMMTINAACRRESQSEERPVSHLIHRKPEGTA
jgi:hypothetical protein